MAWSFVQKSAGSYSNNFISNQTVSLTSATSTGNIILVSLWGDAISNNPVASNFTVTDSLGLTYTNLLFVPGVPTDIANSAWAGVWGAVVRGSGMPTITCHASPTSFLGMGASEFNGGSITLDGTAVTGANTLAPSLALTIGTTVANDLLITAVNRFSGHNETHDSISSPTNFTLLFQQLDDASFEAGQSEYLTVATATGSIPVVWTDSSRPIYYSGGVIALQPFVAPPPQPGPTGGGGSLGATDPNPNQCYKWNLAAGQPMSHSVASHSRTPYR